MPRELQSIKNKTGGIEHIQTSPLVFLPRFGICPRGMTAGCGETMQEPSPTGDEDFEFGMLMKSEGRS